MRHPVSGICFFGILSSTKEPTMKAIKIPEKTITRLSIYLRCMDELLEEGIESISSHELAERFGLNSAQVRKDLAYFGQFGVRGIGYYVKNLRASLEKILG